MTANRDTLTESSTRLEILDRTPVRDLVRIRLDRIQPDPEQPRRHFDEQSIQELAKSLQDHGQIQPIGICDSGKTGRFIISFGERRWRAAKLLGWSSIECVVVASDQAKLFAFIENVQRVNLNPAEEALAVQQLSMAMVPAAIAKTVSKSVQYVSDCLAVNDLPADLLNEIRSGTIRTSLSVLAAIARLPDGEHREAAIAQLRTGTITVSEVRERKQALTRPRVGPSPMLRGGAIRSMTVKISEYAKTYSTDSLGESEKASLRALRDAISRLLD